MRGSANANTERIATLLSLGQSFRVTLYSTQLEGTAAAQLEREGRAMRSLRGVDDGAAKAMLQLAPGGCAILLDACGWTSGSRPGLLALRPCSVQVAVLGFAGSYGGSGLVDSLTVDRIVLGPARSAAASHEEKQLLMPHSYQVFTPSGRMHEPCCTDTTSRRVRPHLFPSCRPAQRVRKVA